MTGHQRRTLDCVWFDLFNSLFQDLNKLYNLIKHGNKSSASCQLNWKNLIKARTGEIYRQPYCSAGLLFEILIFRGYLLVLKNLVTAIFDYSRILLPLKAGGNAHNALVIRGIS